MAKIREVGVPEILLRDAIDQLGKLYAIEPCDHLEGICHCDLVEMILRLRNCLKTPAPKPNKEMKP